MLIGFNVGNFLSIRDIQRFSMIKGMGDNLENHIVSHGGFDFVRGSFVYGSNASGKSNFIRAFRYSRDIILGEKERIYHSFKSLNYAHRNKMDMYLDSPSYFEYELLISGQVFSYGIEVVSSTESVIGEWLFQIIDGAEEMIFSIDQTPNGKSSVAFTSLNSYLDDFISSSTHKTFLSYISAQDAPDSSEIKAVFDWFSYSLVTLSSEAADQLMLVDEGFLDRIVFYLKRLDTGISGFERFSIDSIELKSSFNNLSRKPAYDPYVMYNKVKSADGTLTKTVRIPDDDSEFDPILIEKATQASSSGRRCILISNGDMLEFVADGDITSINEIRFLHGASQFPLPYRDESYGTRRLIEILSNYEMDCSIVHGIPLAIPKNRVFIIDELECSIHSLATLGIVRLFYERPDSEDMQLIATTHESRLLNLKSLRRDEIWFVDSVDEVDDRYSSIYSLESFDDLGEKSIDYAYLEGKYGAIPFLTSLNNDGEDF